MACWQGESQGSEPPRQGRLLSNTSPRGERQLLVAVGGEGVLTESSCGPRSVGDNEGGHHFGSPHWVPGPLSCLFRFLFTLLKELTSTPHFSDRNTSVQGGELTCPAGQARRLWN